MPKTNLSEAADFEALYERHWKYVYRLCYVYVQNEPDAEDCCEDVFVKVLAGKHVFSDELHERKWLTVVAVNLCKDRLKSHARKRTVSWEEGVTEETPAPENALSREVMEAVKALPEKQKDVVWLYYYQGYGTAEIAELLKRPASTVRNQLADARKKLQKELGGESQWTKN